MNRESVAKAVKEHLPEDFYYCEVMDLPENLRDDFPELSRLLAKRRNGGRPVAAWIDMQDIADSDVPIHAPLFAAGLVKATELLLTERT